MSQCPDCCLLQYVCTTYIIFFKRKIRPHLDLIPFRQQQPNVFVHLTSYSVWTTTVCYYYAYNVFVSLFFWCPCMAINNVSVQYNGELLPAIILSTQCYYHHRATCLNAIKRFCVCSPWSHLNVLTFFPPDWGMLRRSRRVLITKYAA